MKGGGIVAGGATSNCNITGEEVDSNSGIGVAEDKEDEGVAAGDSGGGGAVGQGADEGDKYGNSFSSENCMNAEGESILNILPFSPSINHVGISRGVGTKGVLSIIGGGDTTLC